MSYQLRIRELIQQVPDTLVDLSVARKRARTPSQASSRFTPNREQGDWAETILLDAINTAAHYHTAVWYGKSDDQIAGGKGHTEYFEEYGKELDAIGKRPDLLIFRRGDVPAEWGNDISRRPRAELDDVVPLALAGLEVRSSAYLSRKYDEAIIQRIQECIETVLKIKTQIQRDYATLLDTPACSEYATRLASITPEALDVIDSIKPGRQASPELKALSRLSSQLKKALAKWKSLKESKILSITPKVEDLRVVYDWIQRYNVPHFYVQVFFDRVYALSYERILQLLGQPDNNIISRPKKEIKTAKETIKIPIKQGIELANRVDKPNHESRYKEFPNGGLLYHVAFTGGAAHLNKDALATMLGLTPDQL